MTRPEPVRSIGREGKNGCDINLSGALEVEGEYISEAKREDLAATLYFRS